MPSAHEMLQPVVALVAWSMVMWTWMYVTRIPAILGSKMQLDPQRPRGEQMAELPANVRWKADNYNHLLEQPPLFYATVLGLALLGDQSAASVYLAWAYVGLRILHSLLQTMTNHIPSRFALFFVSSLVLFALALRAAMLAF